FMQTPRQQYWESNLIKLQPRPVSSPVDPAVLRKRAVRPLDRGQPDQRTKRRARLSRSQERAGTLHQVARPDEMITTEVQIAFDFAPRNAHRGDDRALENLVFMRQQHASAQSIFATVVGRVAAEIEFGVDHRALPLTNVSFAFFLKRLCQRLEQLRRSALVTSTKCDSDCEFIAVRQIDFAR